MFYTSDHMKKMTTDILIVGGGASGVSAAVQAGRMGRNVVLVEETDWLGGMLSAAGVSAIDGNHLLPSGLWGEFRAKLYEYYNGPESVYTGWVSNTCFEPSVANRIWHEFIAALASVTLFKGYRAQSALKDGQKVTGGEFISRDGKRLEISAAVSIDATEYGDFMVLAGCAYRIGRDSRSETGEALAPENDDDIIQDLTYTAILKDYGPGTDHTIKKPADYDPELFRGCCREWSDGSAGQMSTAQEMLDYGKLPNNKYMINWPRKGNDYYVNLLEMAAEERARQLEKAKEHTRCFVYFIQKQLGFCNLGIADDEFPSSDGLPLIPYIRESRRLRGMLTMTMADITNPYGSEERSLFRAGIAVGNYPLDHHHSDSAILAQEDFPGIPAYTIPYGCLVPRQVDGLLVAEKSISVSHIVNGTTRLQPVVIQIGQVAGAAAALCLQEDTLPAGVNIRMLQQTLLDAGCWLMPFTDISAGEWGFTAVQRVAVTGLMRGEGRPKDWANEFCFDPEGMVSYNEARQVIVRAAGIETLPDHSDQLQNISRIEAARLIWQALGGLNNSGSLLSLTDLDIERDDVQILKCLEQRGCFAEWPDGTEFHAQRLLSRRMFAWLIDCCFDPFNKWQVDIHCQLQ